MENSGPPSNFHRDRQFNVHSSTGSRNTNLQVSDNNTIAAVSTSSNAPVPYVPANSSINQQQQFQYPSHPNVQGFNQTVQSPFESHIVTNQQHHGNSSIVPREANQFANNDPFSRQVPNNPAQSHFVPGNLPSSNNEAVNQQVCYQNVSSSQDRSQYFHHGHSVQSVPDNTTNNHNVGQHGTVSGHDQIYGNISSQPHRSHIVSSHNNQTSQQSTVVTNNQMPMSEIQTQLNYNSRSNHHHNLHAVPLPSFQKPPPFLRGDNNTKNRK